MTTKTEVPLIYSFHPVVLMDGNHCLVHTNSVASAKREMDREFNGRGKIFKRTKHGWKEVRAVIAKAEPK